MKFVCKLLLVAMCLAPASVAVAQSKCSQPIRLVVPYTAGGPQDIMTRLLGELLAKTNPCPVVVLNKVGAAGAIGTLEVARAAPDGHTLLNASNAPHTVLPLMRNDLGYDGLKDFAPISLIASAPQFLIINANLPVHDLKSFIEYARKNPGKIEYGTAGAGSLSHLSTVLFAQGTGLDLLHIPYKGQSENVAAVMSGDVKMAIVVLSPTVTSNVASGKLKLLGVTSIEPSPLLTSAPPIATILPGYNIELLYGFLAPAGTPPAIVDGLNKSFAKALENRTIKERFKDMGAVAKGSTPEEYRNLLAADLERWRPVIREAGLAPK